MSGWFCVNCLLERTDCRCCPIKFRYEGGSPGEGCFALSQDPVSLWTRAPMPGEPLVHIKFLGRSAPGVTPPALPTIGSGGSDGT